MAGELAGSWGSDALAFLQSKNGQALIQIAGQLASSMNRGSGGGNQGDGVPNYGGNYTPTYRSMMGYVGPSMSKSGQAANYEIAHNANQRAYAIDFAAKQVSKYGSKMGGGGFGMGFSVGYKATQDLIAPYLAYKQAKFEKELYGMQAELSDLNAQAYQTAAEDVIRASHNQVASITFQAGQAKASTRVSQASAGIRVGGTGSAAEVMASQDIVRDMNVNQTLANGITQSFGYQRKKVDAQVNSLGLRAAQSAISPWTAAICTGIQAFSNPGVDASMFSFGGNDITQGETLADLEDD